jgi:hypothetical protein
VFTAERPEPPCGGEPQGARLGSPRNAVVVAGKRRAAGGGHARLVGASRVLTQLVSSAPAMQAQPATVGATIDWNMKNNQGRRCGLARPCTLFRFDSWS